MRSLSAPRVHVWRWPVLLSALSLFGLLSALLGQGGIWWVLSWIALATPLIVIVGCLSRGRPMRSTAAAHDSGRAFAADRADRR